MLKLEDMTSIAEAKRNLSHYVKEAAEGERVITIVKHNKPQAVLVSAPEYEALLRQVEGLKERLFYARLAGRVQEGPPTLLLGHEVIQSSSSLFDQLPEEELFD